MQGRSRSPELIDIQAGAVGQAEESNYAKGAVTFMKYANTPTAWPKQATGLKMENHQGNSTSDKIINSYIAPIFIFPDKFVDKNITVPSLFEWSQ